MRILAVSTLRDEAPHVVEWVAHHRALGVTDFLLFSNDCTDGTDALLEALAPAGVVHLPNVPPKGKSVQWNALKTAWGHDLRKAADWIMCIDCDEFVNLRAPLSNLQELVDCCDGADAIVLPWRLFGHAGQAHARRALTIETFQRAAPASCNYPIAGRQFKTLFRNKGPFRQIGVHRPRLKKDATARWLNGSGQPMPASFAATEHRLTLFGFPAASDLVQLNHYSLRSAESFMVKRTRGLPNRRGKALDLSYWLERNFNTVEDASILHHLEWTQGEMTALLALPKVEDLHLAGLAAHREIFEDLMREEENVKFFGRLLLAASSSPLPDPLIQELVTRYQAANV